MLTKYEPNSASYAKSDRCERVIFGSERSLQVWQSARLTPYPLVYDDTGA